ncbi:MAG: adaptor protein MecA [Defluviitaleaceae bacterium]|nr:adaptor protein MecA [Defluviitaleaceae bacterium]
MKIERISDNQIKFELSKSDLDERDIDVDELSYGSEKTRLLFQEMLIQARVEYNFDSDDTPLMVEAIPMDASHIIIIVTKMIDGSENGLANKLFQQALSPYDIVKSSLAAEPKIEKKNGIDIFSFDDVDIATIAAKSLDQYFTGHSRLYKYQNRVFLVIEEDSYESDSFDGAIILAEFGERHISSSLSESYLQEHGELLIEDNAVEKLSWYL